MSGIIETNNNLKSDYNKHPPASFTYFQLF